MMMEVCHFFDADQLPLDELYPHRDLCQQLQTRNQLSLSLFTWKETLDRLWIVFVYPMRIDTDTSLL